jgi:hypothetical protein
MKRAYLLLTLMVGLLISGTASASLIFSNLSYTASSVTFTIDGDMTGYASPSSNTSQFRIFYDGDQFIGDNNFEDNTWSRSLFDNRTIASNGGTGSGGLSAASYSWVNLSSSLVGATVTNALITLTLAEADLDVNALNPLFTFAWGSNERSSQTILGRALPSVSNPVPSPAPLALLGIGIALIGFTKKRKA